MLRATDGKWVIVNRSTRLLCFWDQDLLFAEVRVHLLQQGALIWCCGVDSAIMRWVIALWLGGLCFGVAFFVALVVWHDGNTLEDETEDPDKNKTVIVVNTTMKVFGDLIE